MTEHPAKFHKAILDVIAPLLTPGWLVLDPFCGVGTIHQLAERCDVETVGIELEPEWATMHPRTMVGDALALPFPDATFDALVTSCCYGNRMADHHNAHERCKECGGTGTRRSWIPENDDSPTCPKCEGAGVRVYKRLTYRHLLGRKLHRHNAGQLQWGEAYKRFHRDAWAEAARVLKPDGVLILNCKDHIRKGKHQRVTAWHIRTIEDLGLHLGQAIPVVTPGMGFGENHAARVEHEVVAALSRGFGQLHIPWDDAAELAVQ